MTTTQTAMLHIHRVTLVIAICILAAMQGCGCMSHVTITNESDTQLLADVSLPHPGPGAFRHHCQFTVLLAPDEQFNSRLATREDRVELPTGPHQQVLLRLMNLDQQGWPDAVYSVWIQQEGSITISGTWDALHVTAINDQGDELDVNKEQPHRWFPQEHRQLRPTE